MEEKDDSFEEDKDKLEENLTIIVSGLSPSVTEDAVYYYFENSRRSGGGEVLNIDFTDIDNGEAIVTFKEVSDLQRLLEGEHRINKNPVEVRRRPPKKKVPPDPVRVHVQGLNLEKTSKHFLALYLEKFSNVEVKEVYFGSNDNALAVFDEEPDFPTLLDKVHKDSKGVEGRNPRLERVPVCTCIQVTGLKVESSDDTIEIYFENERKSGGKDVQKVQRKGKDEALVFFEDPSSVENVIRKEHKLEGNKLTVMAYYPFLHNTMKEKADIQLDSDVLKFIQRNHDSELQEVSKELKIQIEHPKNPKSPVIISISPADNKKDSNQSWDGRVEDFKNFLENFQKSHLDIPSEIFDEIVKIRKADGSSDGSSDFMISFDEHRRLVEVTGKRLCVDAEMLKIKQLTLAVKEDRELMKTVVEVVEDNIPQSRLKLLEMSGICEKLQNDHQHLTIAVDSTGQKLFLKGPRCLLQEVKVEIFKFISKIVDKTTEIPVKLVDVLRKPLVSRFMLDLLKEKGIGAVLLYNQSQVTVVGVDSTNAKHAEKILLDAVRERSLRLTPENAALIQSSLWTNFKSSLSPNCMVQVSVDISCSTVWICGIARYVDECFDKITDFLERNTILRKTIQTGYGVTFFLSEVWKTKIEEIKTKLADYSIDMRTAPNRKGIEISGTEAGLQKCLTQVRVLIDSIHKGSVLVDKPGMKKYFTKEKGERILKITEAKHRCIIIAKANNKIEIAAHQSINEEEVQDQGSTQELVCSYAAKQGKKMRKPFAAERDFRQHKDHSPNTLIGLRAKYSLGDLGMSETPRSLRHPQGFCIQKGGFGGFDLTLPQAQTTLGDLDTKLELLIFAGCQEDLQKAVKEINGIIQDNSARKVIERQAVTMLSSQHYRKIHALELKYDVKATLEKEFGRIVVRGMTDDILNVMGEIYSLLDHVKEEEDERKQAEALSKVIQWMYKNVDTDAFEPFEPLVNAKIEAGYDNKKSGVDIGDGQYRVDFKLMNMEIRDCGVTEVKRVNQSVLLPKHWTPQPKDHDGFEKTVHLYQLDPSNDALEYESVQSHFRQSCPNNIVKIERVQNPALYGTYAIRKKKMDETKRSNEMNLFHGTPGVNCKLINHKGFNRIFHGKNGTVYGNGVYFTLQSSYSARSTYSPPDANGYRYMYLTKVLVGEYTIGKQGLITPPPKSAADPTDTYDTVVDQIPNPSIFVVFYDWQCYPEYLITFQGKRNANLPFT